MSTKRIYLTGEINTEAYVSLSKKFRVALNSKYNEIDLILNSVGGDIYDALAIYDLIAVTQETVTVNTISTGLVASAATLIMAAGNRRYLSRNAWVMVHEDSPTVPKNVNVSTVERAALHSRRLEDQWNALMAKHTKLTAKEWTELNKTDLYLTPQECLEYGMIDEII